MDGPLTFDALCLFFPQLSPCWGGSLIHFLWQSTALVALATLIDVTLFKNTSSAWRAAWWTLIGFKLLLLPLWSVTIWLPENPGLPTPATQVFARPESAGRGDDSPKRKVWPASANLSGDSVPSTLKSNAGHRSALAKRQPVLGMPASATSRTTVAINETQPNKSPPTDGEGRATSSFGHLLTLATPWLFLVWLFVAAGRGLLLLSQWRELRRLLSATSPGSEEEQQLVADLARQVGLRSAPQVRISLRATNPFVCGLLRPAIVFPQGLTEELSHKRLRQIVAHELAHLMRRDLWWCWIDEILSVLYWFHPAVWWVTSCAWLYREAACDRAAVVWTDSQPGEYAEMLVDVLGRHSAQDVRLEARVSA